MLRRSSATGRSFVTVMAPLNAGSRWMHRWQRRGGQIATEWLMVAGILTAVAIIITGILKPTVVAVVRSLARSVRTPGL